VITDDIFQEADEHQLDKDHRINVAVAFSAIIGLGGFVQPFEIRQIIEPAIEIIFRHPLTQPKGEEPLSTLLFFPCIAVTSYFILPAFSTFFTIII
jgi:hypothetical protein